MEDQVFPSHYIGKNGTQLYDILWEFISEEGLKGALVQECIQYMARAGKKGSFEEDIKKVKRKIELYLEKQEKGCLQAPPKNYIDLVEDFLVRKDQIVEDYEEGKTLKYFQEECEEFDESLVLNYNDPQDIVKEWADVVFTATALLVSHFKVNNIVVSNSSLMECIKLVCLDNLEKFNHAIYVDGKLKTGPSFDKTQVVRDIGSKLSEKKK